MKTLSELQLVVLAENHAIHLCEVIPIVNGWQVRINGDQVLASERRPVRRFATVDSAVKFLRKFGISRIMVGDLSNKFQR